MAVDIHSKQNLEDEVYQKDGYVLLNLWGCMVPSLSGHGTNLEIC